MRIAHRLQKLEHQIEQQSRPGQGGHYFDPKSNMLIIQYRTATIFLPDNKRATDPGNLPLPPTTFLERARSLREAAL